MTLIAASLLPICRLPTAILARHTVGECLVERSRIVGIICAPTYTVRKARAGWIAATIQDLREEAASDRAIRWNALAVLLELGGRRACPLTGYTGAVRGLEVRVVAYAVKIGAVDVGVNLAVDEDIVIRFAGGLATIDLGEDCRGRQKREDKNEIHNALCQLNGDEMDQKG